MIGKDDFVLHSTDGEVPSGAPDESDTIPSHTEQGTTIGTPAYMSPEQASGLIDQLGPASDVYSLGASLYELLTGQVAFRNAKISKVIKKVLAADFPPPRAIDRSIPAPLESICLKAMATDTPARYHSVRALAQDLEHWLADEPVAAYPERRIERLGRWIRQHRNWAYAGAATLLGIALVASVAVVVIEGARRSETTARKEAETNFDMAQRAVDVYLTNVSENTLLKEQDSLDIRTLRRDLLNSALDTTRNSPNSEERPKAPPATGEGLLSSGTAHQGNRLGSAGGRRTPLGPSHLGATREGRSQRPRARRPSGRLLPGDRQNPVRERRLRSAAMQTLRQSRAILERLAVLHPSGRVLPIEPRPLLR